MKTKILPWTWILIFLQQSVAHPTVLPQITKPQNLNFSPGDIIACFINPFALHIMLGSYDKKVIHAPGAGGTKRGLTFIKEEPFESVAFLAYKRCYVINLYIDAAFCQEKCQRPYSTDEMIKRARSSVAEYGLTPTNYDLHDCNCEHWVTFWRYGEGYSAQIGRTSGARNSGTGHTGPNCPAIGLQLKCKNKNFWQRWFSPWVKGTC